jgi:protein TonB
MPKLSAPYAPPLSFDASTRPLTWALGISLVLHAFVLSLHFRFPDAFARARESALDIILVNSKSAHRPTDAQARAQTNLDGGGNTDEERRARTPLPPAAATREGDDLVEAHRRVAALEASQQQLLTTIKSARVVPAAAESVEPTPDATPAVSGLDLADRALAIAKLEAQIDRQTDEYNKRPRKREIGTRAEEYRFAQYVEDWRHKVERVGNLNYPESAKGRLYGDLLLTVSIRSDGTLAGVEIHRSSGHKVLDDAARRIVQMAAPFAEFPPNIRKDTDVIEITRVWKFTRADELQSSAQ